MTSLAQLTAPVLKLPATTTYEEWLATGRNLAALLRYEPDTGKLFWRPRPRSLFTTDQSWRTWNTRYAGQEALSTINAHGYRHGAIFGKTVKAHRAAWAVAHGRWPEHGIDHINGDRADNRLVNLRDVPQSENRKNASRATNNQSGVNGVHWCNTWNRWIAKIKIGGKTKSLGYFIHFEDAVAARLKANKELGFMPRHGKERVA